MPSCGRALPIALFVCLASLHMTALAAPGDDRAPMVVRTYDVRDLLIHIPNFNDVPELGVAEEKKGPPQARPEPDGPTRQELLDALVRTLPLPEAPKVHEGQLVVRATVPQHTAVMDTLAVLRTRMATQVTVDVRLARVDDAAMQEIELVHPELARKLHLATFNGGDRTGTPLTEAEAQRLTVEPISVPRITLFNGQQAYVLLANQRAFTADVVARDGKGGKEEFEAVVKTVQSGVVLQAQATAAPDGRTVALNARLQCCTLHGMRETAAPNFPPEKKLKVQVPDFENEIVAVNAVVPKDAYLLFGRTDAVRPNLPEGQEAKAPPVVAVVRVKVDRRQQPSEVH